MSSKQRNTQELHRHQAEPTTFKTSNSLRDYRNLFNEVRLLTCLRGAFPPVDFLAVCLVLAMVDRDYFTNVSNE